jgi:quercetin dioxygenase-like cupin family protein
MHKPEPVDQGAAFDLVATDRELRSERQYEHSGHAARTLVLAPDLRVVLVVMRAQSRIAEHHADATASIQALSGRFRVKLPSHTVELQSGRLLVLGPGLHHDVEAAEDGAFLLTLGWAGKG